MRRPQVAAALAVFLIALTSLPVQAANAAQSTGQAPSTGRHCAIALQAVRVGQSPTDAAPPVRQCYATFSEAVTRATGGELRLPRDTEARSAAPELAAADRVIAIEFDDASYGGASAVIYSSNGEGCYNGNQFYVWDMRALGFDDRTTSAKMYASCWGRHYENLNLGGGSFLCRGNCPGFGSYNNRTTSIKFF